jgi:uncharacterized membrane protein
MTLNIILAFICAGLGGFVLDEPGGALMGFVIGCMIGVMRGMKLRIEELERRYEIIKIWQTRTTVPRTDQPQTAAQPRPETPKATPPASIQPETPMPERKPAPAQPRPVSPTLHPSHVPLAGPDTSAAAPIPARQAIPGPQHPKETETPPDFFKPIKDFFTGGNVVVRIGIIILFFGVAFLFKYAIQRNMLPIELRLFGVAAGAAGLMVLGWRLRETRSGYALILQGGGMGILYMTLFAAARLYGLFPLSLAFMLMVCLTVFSGYLAVRQDSLALAAFGTAGGFLAPILTSSGEGSHVMLFSYYAFLNAGILGMAWFKAWRVLNLIGFFFTFGIGAVWGYVRYQPADFNSTEPFLILFFLFYVAISILFAHRQPPRLKGYVDGTLVFGLPAAAFALQSQLMATTEYGLAWSAAVLCFFYILLASVLRYRDETGMKLLTEAFLALGVAFGTLTIPLALDDRWTSAAWALEGAALVWIGVHQNRILARNAGLLLQFGSGAAFMMSTNDPVVDRPIFNSLFMGGILVSLTGLFSAWYLEQHQERLRPWEKSFFIPMLIWGLCWWFPTGLNEIRDYLGPSAQGPGAVMFIVLSCGIMGFLSGPLKWQAIQYPPIGLLPFLWGLVLFLFISGAPHLMIRWHILPCALGFGIQYYLIWRFESVWNEKWIQQHHISILLLMVFVLSWESAWVIREFVFVNRTWSFLAWGAVPAGAVFFMTGWGRKIPWPVERFSREYVGKGLFFLCGFIWIWQMYACTQAGNPHPLSYMPVLSPLDITQLLGFAALFQWIWTGQNIPEFMSDSRARKLYGAASFGVFIWINAMVARSVHFWGNVPFTALSLHHSVLFQSAISIVWTFTALGMMAAAARRGARKIWIMGAVLLGAVVLKLFIIDLSGTGTIARIVSFLAVGGLMLVIGYVSPIPPGDEE